MGFGWLTLCVMAIFAPIHPEIEILLSSEAPFHPNYTFHQWRKHPIVFPSSFLHVGTPSYVGVWVLFASELSLGGKSAPHVCNSAAMGIHCVDSVPGSDVTGKSQGTEDEVKKEQWR